MRAQPAQKAQPLLQAALRADSFLSGAYYYLGKALSQLGQDQAAVENIKESIAVNPQGDFLTSAYYQLFLVYRKLNRKKEAKAAFENFERLKAAEEQKAAHTLSEKLKRNSPN